MSDQPPWFTEGAPHVWRPYCQMKAAPAPAVARRQDARLETYIISGARGSGAMCMNGAAAHLIGEGEQIIVMGFELSDSPIVAWTILVDPQNRFVPDLAEATGQVVPDTLTAEP